LYSISRINSDYGIGKTPLVGVFIVDWLVNDPEIVERELTSHQSSVTLVEAEA